MNERRVEAKSYIDSRMLVHNFKIHATLCSWFLTGTYMAHGNFNSVGIWYLYTSDSFLIIMSTSLPKKDKGSSQNIRQLSLKEKTFLKG